MTETGNIHTVSFDNKNVKIPVFMANRGHSCVERTSQIVFSEFSETALELIFPLSRTLDSHIFSSLKFSSTIVNDIYNSLLQSALKDPYCFTRRKIFTLGFRFDSFSHLSFKASNKKKIFFPP